MIVTSRSGARRRRWTIVVLSGALLVAAVLAGRRWAKRGGGPHQDPPRFSSLLERLPSTLAPGIHILGRLSPGVAYVVQTSAGLALIDSGLAADSASVIEQLHELGLDARELRIILLTHAHGDHSLGAKRLRALSGAKIYAGKGDAAPLRAGRPRVAFFADYDMQGVPIHPTPVDVELSGGEQISLGDSRFEAVATPGHTPGSVCYLIRRDGMTALFAGDTIMSTTELGSYSAYLAPRYRGDAQAALESFRKLRAMPAPTLLLPGHPPGDGQTQDARITGQQWQGLLDAGIREMEALVARYETDGSDFLDGFGKEILPGLHYLGEVAGSAMYALETSGDLILFDAPGESALMRFLDRRLRAAGLGSRRPTAVLLTSADPEAVSGLPELVRETGCVVVAPKDAVDSIRRLCPAGTTVHSHDVVPGHGQWPITAVPLKGMGTAPMAYKLQWRDKGVLVSGRFLSKMGRGQRRMLRLVRALAVAGNDARAFSQSLEKLSAIHVDVWLPAQPVDGQNANLYRSEWDDVVTLNRMLAEERLRADRRTN